MSLCQSTVVLTTNHPPMKNASPVVMVLSFSAPYDPLDTLRILPASIERDVVNMA